MSTEFAKSSSHANIPQTLSVSKFEVVSDSASTCETGSSSASCCPEPRAASAPLSESISLIVRESETSAEDYLRQVARTALDQIGTHAQDVPLMMLDITKVKERYDLWKKALPRVQPYYAMKCNPNPVLINVLSGFGASFDCATAAEMDAAIALGHDRNSLVYANPCKLPSHIAHARVHGVDLTVFDNASELRKLKNLFPEARVLLRIACYDTSAQCPMSGKFGATPEVARNLVQLVKELQIDLVGVHFHVGSGCQEANAYRRALQDARAVFDFAATLGINLTILDIGGGYPARVDVNDFSENSFMGMTSVICDVLDKLFPPHVQIMGEPGRFFAAESCTLLTQVFSKSEPEPCEKSSAADNSVTRYYQNDGLYGSFNCQIFDHQETKPFALKGDVSAASKSVTCTIFGPTCDGFDKVVDKHEGLPELHVGDHLLWRTMGAYTTAAATTFNGFQQPNYFYYRSGKEEKELPCAPTVNLLAARD